MATQQLTQPIINPIAAFDATQPYEVTFLAIGGAQVIGNRIVISDNQTGDIIYDNRITTMKLSHTVPANTLTNGGYYNVVIYTIDSANNFSQASVPVPFYCYSQPTLTIVNIPAGSTIENGTYSFQGSYAQQQNESLNSYQFILYDSNKTELSQSDVIYYASNNSLSYTFAGMSNDTSYYIELKGQTVNNTLITTGLLFFTVRYSQPASFAIVDLVNDCENGFIQISSNIVAIDGKSNPEPPIYIDNKEVDLRDPDSWVEWDKGFDIKDDFTMRVWGRDFNDFEPIITLSNKNNTDSEPNRIEMKWMVADVIKTLPEYALVSGKNISIVNGYKTDISDLSIYGNSEQIQKDSIQLGKGNPLSLNTTSDMYLDVDVYGNHSQVTQEGSSKSVNGTTIQIKDVDATKPADLVIKGNEYQDTRDGLNLFNVFDTRSVSEGASADEDGWITVTYDNTSGTALHFINYFTNNLNLKTSTDYAIIVEIKNVTGTGQLNIPSVFNNQSQFESSWAIEFADVTESKYKIVKKTLSDFSSSIAGLRAYVVYSVGKSGSITFRVSVLEDTSVDLNTFVYQPYGISPSPDYPSEIKTVGSNINKFDLESYYNSAPVTRCTKQLLDNGIRLTFDAGTDAFIGSTVYSGDALSTAYRAGCIAVKPNTTYTISLSSAPKCYISYLNENYTGVRGITQISSANFTFTTDASTYYIYPCFGYSDSSSSLTTYDFTNIKFEEGSSVTPYSPYNQGSVEIDIINKNLLPKTTKTTQSINGITFTINNDGTIKANGTATARTTLYLGNSVTLKSGTYTTSSGLNGVSNVRFGLEAGSSYLNTNNSRTDTFDSEILVKNSYFQIDSGITVNNLTLKPMIEIGSTATGFVEYQSQNIIMPVQQEMLEGDYIKAVEHHNWRKMILTGEETNLEKPTNYSFRFSIYQNKGTGIRNFIYCTHYTAGNSTNVGEIDISSDGTFIYMHTPSDEITTVEQLKTWLKSQYDAGAPVTIYYKLKTPLELALTDSQQTAQSQLTNMTLYQGTTNIYNNGSYPAIMDLNYNIVRNIPSPDYQSEIKAVGDNINYLNWNNCEEGKSWTETGKTNNVNTWAINDYQEVNVSDITFSSDFETPIGSSFGRILTFDKDKKIISNQLITKLPYTVNFGNAKYYTFFFVSQFIPFESKLKLEKGTVATPYSPYGMGSVEAKILDRNIFNIKQTGLTTQTAVGVTITLNSDNSITINGTATSNNNFGFTSDKHYFEFFKGQPYTIFQQKISGESTGYLATHFHFYDEEDNRSWGWLGANGNNNSSISTKVATQRGYAKTFVIYVVKGVTYTNYRIKLMVLNGSYTLDIVPEYSDYQAQSLIMPIQQPMLDGDYIKNTELHEWNKLTLTGDESWSIGNVTIDGVQHKQFYMNLSYLSSERTKAMCNTFQNNLVLTNAKENYFYLGGNLLVICNVTRSGVEITTLDDWKSYLQNQNNSGTPVIVYYKPSSITNLSLTTGQQEAQNTLINAYDQITNVSSDNDLSILNVSTTPVPSIKLPSTIYSSGDKQNQLEDLGMINVNYNQGYFQTTDTDFVLKPDFMYNLSFDYIVNSATTDLYFTISYKSNGEIFDITDAIQYSSQFTGRNNVGFMVPENIPENSTLSIKFARTIIQANVSVSVENVSLVKGRFTANYQSPDIYNIYPTVTQKNIFNYNDVYYIRNQNATLTFIQNGFSSEVVTPGEKSFFEFGFPNVLQPGNKYAISYNSYGEIKSAKIYTMDKETGETLNQIETNNGVFTAPSNLYDIKAEFVLDDSVANNQVQVWNIQLESGEQVTEAELYTANNTDLKLETPLRSIGNYKDLACLESPNILNPETQTAVVKGSTTYSFSQSGTTAYEFDYINEDNNVISSESMASGQFTTPDNCVKIKFNTTSDIIKTNKLQVNLGDTALVYYPYINEPNIIRYFGEIVLTGNENISLGDSYLGIKQFNLTFNAEWVNDNIVRVASNFFKGVTFNRSWTINNSVTTVGGGNIRFMTSAYSTADEFKAFLKEQYDNGKPVVVIYKLIEQTIEPLSSDNILALQNLKTYDGISNVFTNNSMPADIHFSYINGQSEQETKNAYVTLKCWNGNIVPYFIHSNYIDIPKETDKVFIWLRRRNNIFDLKIENLGDYGEDKPGDQGNPQVAITIDNTTTTTITVTANSIDIVTLSKLRFSKDNGITWDAEFSLDGLSSTNSYTFTGLQPATTYQIRVEVENINGITNGITEQVITTAN